MADTVTVKDRLNLGDAVLVIAEITGDGSETSKTAKELGLERVVTSWWQDIDDDNAMQCSSPDGTTITHEAITSTKKQLLFAIGY